MDTTDTLLGSESTWNNGDVLDKLLRGELAALASYDLGLARVRDPAHRGVLLRCRGSHRERAWLLAHQLESLGRRPSLTAGPWGWLARLVEGGAALLGIHAALRALHEGELLGLRVYLEEVEVLSGPPYELVSRRLIPQQRSTEAQIGELLCSVAD